MEAFFFYMPICLPEEFSTYESSTGETRGIVWAIPITRQEAFFVRDNGWEAFVDLLQEHDPDLLDMHRKSVV